MFPTQLFGAEGDIADVCMLSRSCFRDCRCFSAWFPCKPDIAQVQNKAATSLKRVVFS
jgi:hypothetical protein